MILLDTGNRYWLAYSFLQGRKPGHTNAIYTMTIRGIEMNPLKLLGEGLRRLFIYFAVLRPCFLIAFVIVYLPLTAAADWVPGNSMLANLFVDYDFMKTFWFAFALSGSVWALMLITCLILDFARDRQDQQDVKRPWLPNPPQENRWVTIPIRKKIVFWLFTSLGAPAGIIVVLKATSASLFEGFLPRLNAFAGLIVGGLVSYLLMNLVAAFVHLADNDKAENDKYALPWRPIDWIANRLKRFGVARAIMASLGRWVGQFAKATRRGFSAGLVHVTPGEIFEDGTQLLKPNHFYAVISAVSLIFMYGFIYWWFKPTGPIRWPLEEVPPAGFIFALLLPLIWIISALWAWLGRYRLAFYLAICISFVLALVASRFGNPVHTYDVVAVEASKRFQPQNILQPLVQRGQKNLIIVAASGGGILAAGWTAQVLTKLHSAYPDFGKELRLISAVSGGSVGAAHYVNSVSEILRLTGDSQRAALQEVAEDAMRSSLASTSYGLAFPDFKRAIFPFIVDEEFDRARLLEMDWRRIANCRRQTAKTPGVQSNFRQFCRNIPEGEREKVVWFSEWLEDIQRGDKPAVVFNATVMETGERIAITPLSTLHSDWAGGMEYPLRRDNAQTLSEFLSVKRDSEPRVDPSKADKGDKEQKKNPTCPQYTNGYDIDVWTAARLSATFSYVSPAASAACLDYKNKSRSSSGENSPGQLHLIDGGYHDNYGVASALDWLSATLEAYRKESKEDLPVSRIALVEIRAKPDIPADTAQNEWSSTWLGPFWGLFNSWGYVQISSNDTAVNRRIADFKNRLGTSAEGVQFDSFVFISDRTGPLSWHLSEEQKANLRSSWNTDENQKVLTKLLEFLRQNRRPGSTF